jgi:signal transduction histidine kinase
MRAEGSAIISQERERALDPAEEQEWFGAHPELGRFFRGIDWRAAGLRPPTEWSDETRRAVEACANAGFLEACRASGDSVAAFASRRIERLEDELRRAVRVRDDFLSIASHELKTPITALRLQLQLTRRTVNPETNLVPSAPKLASVLDLASRQVDRLMHLIEDLLDVARIEAGKLQYRFGTADLREVCEEVIARYQGHPNAPQLKAPAEHSAYLAYCDRDRIEQILVNLVSNAVKYGGERPAEISIERAGENLRIAVKDFGLGIAKEKQQAIFDRFERAVSHHYISGLGLGLFISRQIAEAHSGKISVESTEGRGSTFTLELPAQQRAVQTPA